MNTLKSTTLLLAGCLLLTAATLLPNMQTQVSNDIIGTWRWESVINAQTQEHMGIEMVTMGMATEVKTEFKKDFTYVESKMRKGSTEYSTTSGQWKLEKDDVLSMFVNEKWQNNPVIRLANDSLILGMNKQMHLLMIRQK